MVGAILWASCSASLIKSFRDADENNIIQVVVLVGLWDSRVLAAQRRQPGLTDDDG